jgi:hypothetical protein
MNVQNLIDEIVTKKPLVAFAGIVVVSVVILAVCVLRPQIEGKGDRSWLPDNETIASISKLLFRSMTKR